MNFWDKIVYRLFKRPVYRLKFARFGERVSIRKPICLRGMQYMEIGDGVVVKEQGWLEANPIDGNGGCRLSIGRGTSIGYFCHIYAVRHVEIAQDVLIGSGVYIADCTHGYRDVSRPVIDQPAEALNPVAIGEGSWIGQHAAILGVRIGKHCVVGAHAVVLDDVPDYCVVAGVPARIIKRYDFEREEWVILEK